MNNRPPSHLPILTAVLLLAAACGGAPERYAAPLAPAGERVGIGVSRLEVRQVSMPSYALDEEIWVETAEGALTADDGLLWADDPVRGVTQELTRQLAAITGARVAAEPWPFDALPQARVEVRIDEFVAGNDRRFRISGQYFTIALTGGRDRATEFSVAAPIAPDSGAPGIAAARAVAVRDLARLIATDAL
ncbi:MAG: ABC-type transport auxiliary lipoprotein family protein [Pseudomonadota bacterium]